MIRSWIVGYMKLSDPSGMGVLEAVKRLIVVAHDTDVAIARQ